MEPDGPSARQQAIVALEGTLDADALRQALARAVERHESLRTTFVRQSGLLVPVQAVHGHLEPAWRTVDGRDPAARVAAIAEDLAQPFDLTAGPLVRALLLAHGAERHELVLTVSGLAADPGSVALLVGELATSYDGSAAAVEDPLQYADFAAWQHELRESDDDEARSARERWSELATAAEPALPFVHPTSGPFAAAQADVEIGPELEAGLRELAARYGVSVTAAVQAAWHVLLARFAGEDRVAVSLLTGERRHDDLDGAIGAFGRPVPVLTRAGATVSFAEVMREVAEARDEALVLQDYAPAGHQPLPGTAFVDVPLVRAEAGDVRIRLDRLTPSSALPLALTCLAGEEGLKLLIAFDARRHLPEQVDRYAAALTRLLGAAAASPGATLSELELLTDAERRLVLEDFNATAAPAPQAAVHELIAAHAVAAPERDAVVDEHGAITYRELDGRANQLAHRLRRAGVGPDVAVGLSTDRSIDMVVGMLGILKAGGAYVPLHHEHPRARLGHQLEAAGARAIVTQEALLHRLPDVAGDVVCLDRDRAALEVEPTTAPEVAVSGEHLAYVIFTSGSTGTPKGVLVTHGNVVNYATDIARRVGADDDARSFGMVTAISTDLGNTSLFGALCSGGTLVLVSPAAAADPGAMARVLEATPVDVLKITPSHLGALLAAGDARVLPRKWLVLGGERAPWDLIERVRALSDVAILNHYGPTETTVGSCTFVVGADRGPYRPASVPVGGPIANTACYVLDPADRPVPIGMPGRLLIGGTGVARGYAGAPALTAERFLADPFAGGRMYDTGDHARWLPSGALEFLGRADEQVKIRGYRVEPAEVETALRSHERVVEAVAMAQPSGAGDLRLVAYCAVSAPVGEDELRAHLAEWLPEFMLPSVIVTLDRLPQTPSGKVDRLALPDPDSLAPDAGDHLAPRTPMEEAVATIWSQVLGMPSVGIEDDFFALGGHSLLATQVVAQVRSDFAVDLPLHSLFTFPTVASLTAEVVRMMGSAEDEETARLMAELEGMSDEEAERLLSQEPDGA